MNRYKILKNPDRVPVTSEDADRMEQEKLDQLAKEKLRLAIFEEAKKNQKEDLRKLNSPDWLNNDNRDLHGRLTLRGRTNLGVYIDE